MNKEEEEAIRRIVREELKSLLESMKETSERANGSETGELMSAGLAAVGEVAERVAHHLPHDWDCRKRQYFLFDCDCGVGNGGVL